MQALSYQDSTGTVGVLEQYDAAECQSSETSWLHVAWRPAELWKPLLQFRGSEDMTGMNFSDRLAAVRVGKAKNLLLNPNYYITEIAFELGFDSLIQFSRAFKTMVGEPPHAYRARLPGAGSLIFRTADATERLGATE